MHFSTNPLPKRARSLPLYKTLLCLACVAILLVNGIFLLRNLDGLKAANSLQDQTAKVTDELQHLNLLVTDAESNLRGYFLSGSPSYLGSVQARPGPDRHASCASSARCWPTIPRNKRTWPSCVSWSSTSSA